MQYTVNQNIIKLIEYLKSNPNDFGKSLGLKRTDTIYNIVSNKSKASTDVIELITKKYEFVNLRWLLTGEGEMLVGKEKSNIIAQQNNGVGTQTNNFHSENEWKLMERLLEEKDKQLQDKDKMIEMLLNKSN